MPKSICFQFFCTVKIEFVVSAIIFFVCFSSTIHASKRRSHAIWTVENELVVVPRCYRCRLDRIYGVYMAWKIFTWGYLSHRVNSVCATVDNNGNRVNPVCGIKELILNPLNPASHFCVFQVPLSNNRWNWWFSWYFCHDPHNYFVWRCLLNFLCSKPVFLVSKLVNS
jgi:hypothetical protein